MMFIKKSYISAILFFLLFNASAFGCLMEYPTHNYYMLSYVNRSYDQNIFKSDIDKFWQDYTKGLYEEYPVYDIHGLESYIKKQNDTEMLEYVHSLNQYLDICSDINSWDYPEESDLSARESTLRSLVKRSNSYSGNRLRSQYSLLYMRSNMLLGEWGVIKKYWESKACHLPDNVFRRMMENIYAGSLYREGNMEKSSEIYVRQGDEESIHWLLNKYINIDGIRYVYYLNPNSSLLPYLIERYVNGVQESLDQLYDDQLSDRGQRVAISLECIPFYKLAEDAISNPKVNDPCMWSTAEAMLYYLNRDFPKAQSVSTLGQSLAGSERIKSNSRCVNILINSSDPSCDRSWLSKELSWLESQIDNETPEGYCFSHAYDRVLMKSLNPLLASRNEKNLSLAVAGFYKELDVIRSPYHIRSSKRLSSLGEATWNDDFNDEYMNLYLYPLNASDCVSYYKYLTTAHTDSLSAYICSRVYKDSNFFNDIIGTKYISEGKFSEAIAYLEKVDLSYLNKLNTSYYMHSRDYLKECWFDRQYSKEDMEGISKFKFTSNPKIDFCRTILDLERSFKSSTDSESRCQMAYKLGTAYYQASFKGDCWWLSSYSKSVVLDEPRYEYECDFVEKAKYYLKESSKSRDAELKGKSLYALAYIPIDLWADSQTDYDEEGNEHTTYMNPHPESFQYQYLSMLNSYYESHKDDAASYLSKCDVLKQFRKLKWYSE